MYIPLYNKTTYSFLSSLLEVEDLVHIAIQNQLDSIAIVDDNMFGVMEFISKCLEHHINPIVGVDFSSRLLYAKTYYGYQNLLKLVNIRSERELTEEDFLTYKKDLICIPLDLSLKVDYETIFYPYQEQNQIEDFSKFVYLPKLLYKNEKDYELLKYLELLRDNKTIIDNYEEKRNCYYCNPVNIPREVIENTFQVASICHLELPNFPLNLAYFDKAVDADVYLKNLSYKGLEKRLDGNISNSYRERLKYELEVIQSMGFSNYFLVVYDFIKYAKNKGILVGPGRGSAAGSLVSYTLGITDIDPIKYDLLFERFLNSERITMPDIDTDFPDIYREEIIQYVNKKYGKKQVANIITFLAMGAKLCVRDIGRVMNVALADIDYISSLIGNRKEKLEELIKIDPRFEILMKEDLKIKKLLEVASKVEGIKRHTSVHAAGIIISNTPLDEIVPLIYDEGTGDYISGYEAMYLEKLGLLKMDFLGIKNLTTIMEIEKEIEEKEGIKIAFKDIPLEDKETMLLFSHGDTNGIFQFESSGMKTFLKELKPRNFNELSDAIALYRPGPAGSIPSFIKRKNGLEPIDCFTPALENVLKPTFGIIIYQEQIMQIANIIAGFSFKEADNLRRAMSKKKKEILEEAKEKFIQGSLKNGYSLELAEKIYELILKFSSYGFNKSHSIAYTVIAFRMAYLKVHYKRYFYVSLLNSVIGDVNKTIEYLYEMKKYDLTVEKPDIRFSTDKYIIKNQKILAPFSIIKGINKLVCSKIIEQDRKYNNLYEAFASLNTLTKNNFELLIQGGCFDSFGYTRKTLLKNLDSLYNYSNLCKDLEKELVLKPQLMEEKEFSNIELIEMEKELYGFFLSNHPALVYKSKIHDIIDLKDMEQYFNTYQTSIVLVEWIREIKTKKGEKMLFFKGSDEERVVDYTIFPRTYETYFDIRKGYLLKVYGKVEKRNGSYQIIVSNFEKLE